jgi:PAS domain S-box-containing protein
MAVRDEMFDSYRAAETHRASNVGTFGWKVSTGELQWSEETFRIFEYSPAIQPTKALLLERVHPEDIGRVKEIIGRAQDTRKKFDFECRLLMPNRSVKYLRVVAHPEERDDNSGSAEFIGAVLDVTNHKRAEETLRKSEERYRDLINLSPDAIYVIDEDARCVLTNAAGAEMVGCREEELIGTAMTETYLPEERGLVWERLRKSKQWPIRFERSFLRRNGEVIPVEVSMSALREARYQIIIRDIRDRKRVEEALRRSEAYLAESQRRTHTGSWAIDPAKMEITYWSQETYGLYDFDPKCGLPSFEELCNRIHPEDRERYLEAVQTGIGTKTDYEVLFRVVLPDGALKHIHVAGHPIVNASGDVIEIVGTSVDVTERKQAEEERERLRQTQNHLAYISRLTTMGELTASLAHEIKQPISAAITNARTCMRWLNRDQPELEEAREAALRMIKDAMRASDIINHIRFLFTKSLPQRELLDVNDVVHEMIALLRNEANRYSISIRSNLAPNLPSVIADRVQLQQVFMNLMLNAIDAMKEMNPPGELTIESRQSENGDVLISIRDNGEGLPPEHTDQIFNAFFTTKREGTGMGLPISRSIIETHGGRLWATANFPRGAAFHFSLPGSSK